MLEPAAKRPKLFSLDDAGEAYRYDRVRGGLTMPKTTEGLVNLIEDHHAGARWVYDTAIQGQSNQGHEKFIDLKDFEKDEIVEYLKTL